MPKLTQPNDQTKMQPHEVEEFIDRFNKIRMIQPNIVKTGLYIFENISEEPIYVDELGAEVQPGRWQNYDADDDSSPILEWFPANRYISDFEFERDIRAEVSSAMLRKLRTCFGRTGVQISDMFESMLQHYAEAGIFFTEDQEKSLKDLMYDVANDDPQRYAGTE
ncbi:hypothetical protein [Roseovarius sp. MMSF_3281]|uniref:hypothetical protein n=1 Tax=Roseovarius sp. MMSF_3281 TaxID=3046694 RepID=UPI00273EDDDA|nr:hypothetical protein [Roseovarius sp. MMSF_3281]